jgi:peptidoglycan/xylan/chitin deacetylase (PgdA/CDA1 family)
MTNPRVPYRLANDRPRLAAPGGKPIIVHVALNIETWPFDQPMPRKLLPGPHGVDTLPDVPNFSWVEYGLRAGMPRLFELFGSRGIPVSAVMNAGICDDYPRLAERVGEAGWEIVGHGYRQRPLQADGKEAELIESCLERVRKFYGKRPRGWLGPGLKETADTPEILKSCGVDHVFDWTLDDLPDWLTTKHGPLLSIPYTVEINDVPVFAIQQHSSEEFYTRFRDTLECYAEESKRQPRILTMGLHPHIIAVPHRIAYLRRMIDELKARPDTVFMTGSQIADWFVAADAAGSRK